MVAYNSVWNYLFCNIFSTPAAYSRANGVMRPFFKPTGESCSTYQLTGVGGLEGGDRWHRQE
jgi:hypothetical protein